MRRLSAAAAVALASVALLAGCVPSAPAGTPRASAPAASGSPGPHPSASGSPGSGSPGRTSGGVAPAGTPADVVTGLDSPWSMARLDDTRVLVSERDTGDVVLVSSRATTVRRIGTVPGVVHTGEGGLLGLALHGSGAGRELYAYETTRDDNRIVRMPLHDDGGDLSLGPASVVLDGLARASYHNGGRIAFGPDGMLYATVGDAGVTSRAQDRGSLNGKVLRMTPAGDAPADNPFPGSLVYTLGHRNPQGLAWDANGQLWASEFGQDTWDELNRIVAGSNYGWPVVEGVAHDARFVDPTLQWSTDEASPSGLAYVDGTFFLAALRGERLWSIRVRGGRGPTATALYASRYGRLRDVAPGPGGTLWILTDNTDGRGSPHAGDDRILSVRLAPTG